MIKTEQKISLSDLEEVWYDCYSESFNREYPVAFDKLVKLVEKRTNIFTNKVIDRTRSGSTGSITRKRQTGH